jgi:hypothetical protein
VAQYVDFTYYSTSFGGSTILEADFNKYERKARVFLDSITFNRLQDDATLITDAVKDCLCEMMEKSFGLEQEEAATGGKLIASETVDGFTQTYAIADGEKNEIDKSKIDKIKLYNIAREYLVNTGLLYRGVD